MYYSENTIEEVRRANDIVSVISQYVKLEKKGGRLFGLCPFHNEKTPSFCVSPDSQMYYCFGCGQGGNVITFVMDYENYSFTEALHVLAERSGITLPEREPSREEKEKEDRRKVLLAVQKEAATYYHKLLRENLRNAPGRYLAGRGINAKVLRDFGLGYSGLYGDQLYRHLKECGYSDEVLSQSGLVRIEEKGAHDLFWNRIMFPIMDIHHRVIGFGGRVMGSGEPKYLNSPETLIFDKSRNLYGLNYAKSSRRPEILLCEGYMDVISLHKAGFTNAVASLGTALTPGHSALLKRYTDRVILTYDSDEAGLKAALRAIPILKEAGLTVKVISLVPYKDPDELIEAKGAEEFQKRIDQAENAFLFQIRMLERNYDLADPAGKTAFLNEVGSRLLEFSEEVERNNYIEAVSRQYMVGVKELTRMVNRLGGEKTFAVPATARRTRSQNRTAEADGNRQAQQLLLTWLSQEPSLYPAVRDVLSPEDFTEGLYRELAELLFDSLRAGSVNPAEILNHFLDREEDYREAAACFHRDLPDSLSKTERERVLTETVRRVKKTSLEERRKRASGVEEMQALIAAQADLANLQIHWGGGEQ